MKNHQAERLRQRRDGMPKAASPSIATEQWGREVRFVTVPEEQAVISKIRRLRARGVTQEAVAARLGGRRRPRPLVGALSFVVEKSRNWW